MHNATQQQYYGELKRMGLDDARTKNVMDAASKFQTANVMNPAYMQNPQKLMQDSMQYALELHSNVTNTLKGNAPLQTNKTIDFSQLGVPPK